MSHPVGAIWPDLLENLLNAGYLRGDWVICVWLMLDPNEIWKNGANSRVGVLNLPDPDPARFESGYALHAGNARPCTHMTHASHAHTHGQARGTTTHACPCIRVAISCDPVARCCCP